MHTTPQLIELAKKRLALAHGYPAPITDYRLAKLLGVRQQTVSNWNSGKTGIGAQFARAFAEACELPEAYVYACIEHERASDPSVQSILEKIAKKFGGKHAATLTGAFFLLVGIHSPDQANASAARPSDGAVSVYSVKRRIQRSAAGSRFRDALRDRLARWLLGFPVTDPQELIACA